MRLVDGDEAVAATLDDRVRIDEGVGLLEHLIRVRARVRLRVRARARVRVRVRVRVRLARSMAAQKS